MCPDTCYRRTVARQTHALGGGVGSVGPVLVNGAAAAAGLGALSLTLSLSPPGSQPQAPITQHTLDHIKVPSRRLVSTEASQSYQYFFVFPTRPHQGTVATRTDFYRLFTVGAFKYYAP